MRSYDVVMTPSDDGNWVLKSEADKVVAELKKKLDLYKRGWEETDKVNAYLYAQLRHHKYKRCLAMAKLAVKDDYAPWNIKWQKRWLELAEKFKEAK